MDGLVAFLHREQERGETLPFIIAHGGYLHDFPILLASCMKHNCDTSGILTECMFVESTQILQGDGYKRPGLDVLCEELNIKGVLQDDGYKRSGLDVLCEELNIKGSSHSTLEDVYILKTVCNKKPEMLDDPYGYTFGDITYHLNRKLPLPIRKVYSLATEYVAYEELGCILYLSMLRQSQH